MTCAEGYSSAKSLFKESLDSLKMADLAIASTHMAQIPVPVPTSSALCHAKNSAFAMIVNAVVVLLLTYLYVVADRRE